MLFYKSSFIKSDKEYSLNDYEKSLIEYFNEIALETEYFDNPDKITKWRKPMSLYVYKQGSFKEQMATLTSTIKDINNLSSDGFRIEITNDYKNANAFLYLCRKDELGTLAPKFDKLLNDSVSYHYSGFSYVEFKWTNFVITKALMFVDADASMEEQKHSIVEELTQSIGLVNDSDKFPESIFYDNKTGTKSSNSKYSKMDISLISFLYNPQMKPGYKSKTAEIVIKNILKDENEALYQIN